MTGGYGVGMGRVLMFAGGADAHAAWFLWRNTSMRDPTLQIRGTLLLLLCPVNIARRTNANVTLASHRCATR